MTHEEFVAALTVIASSVPPRALLEDAALEGYWIALQDLDNQQLARATKRALRESRFMPSPAELRELAGAAVPSVETAAMVAWQAVRTALDVHDYLVATIDFGPLVNAVIRNVGGWDTLCRATLSELDNPGWLRKRFDEVYRAFARVPSAMLQGDPLVGSLPPNYRGAEHAVVSVDGKPIGPRIAPSGSGQLAGSIEETIRELAEAKS